MVDLSINNRKKRILMAVVYFILAIFLMILFSGIVGMFFILIMEIILLGVFLMLK